MSGFITEDEYRRDLTSDFAAFMKREMELEQFRKEHGYYPTPQPTWRQIFWWSNPTIMRKPGHDIDSQHINSKVKKWVYFKMNWFWATHTWYGFKRDVTHKLLNGHGLWRKCDCKTYIWM